MYIFAALLIWNIVHVHSTGHGVCTADWSYGGNGDDDDDGGNNNGPQYWYKKHPSCGGYSQSPINIEFLALWKPTKKNVISYHNYFTQPPSNVKYTLSNNGHSLMYTFPSDTHYYLMKNTGKYIPLQAHIHFGSFSSPGSEHSVNGKKAQAEIHIVHRNAKYSAEVAKKQSDGLLVVGVFVVRKMYTASSIIKQLAGKAKQLKQPGSSIQIPGFPLLFLLNGANFATTPYINYKGSLTTPPCTENVDWIVLLAAGLSIQSKEILSLRGILNCSKLPMMQNNRPIQRTNKRRVYKVNMM